MEAHERSFTFMGTASYYDIPFFQRAYVWDEENWQELLANFLDQTDSHFLGSIILKQEKIVSGTHPRYMIIDGQQRLTTLAILTRACFDRLIEDKDTYEESVVNDFKQQLRTLLFIKPNKYTSEEDVKIQHSKLDAPAFQEVIKGKYTDCITDGKWDSKYDSLSSKIIRCYLYFRKELHERPIEDVHKVWDLMTEDRPRYLVNIDLDVDENEQKIFDTVNSFGVRLSSSDTIKNAVFQAYIDSLRKDNQHDIRQRAAELYENTWQKEFEADEDTRKYWETTRRYGRMSRDNLEVFLNSFAVIQGFFDPSVDNMVTLPQKYKNTVNAMDWKNIGDFLKLIAQYAEVYQHYFSNFDSDIRWEKASADYYTCREVFERETASLKEAEAERCAAKDKLDAAKKRLLLIECAHYYGQLREIESQIAAISTEIINRENNSESAERLASLKYSACIAITNELQKISSVLEIRYSEKETLEASLSALEAELTEIQHSLNKAKANI